MKKAEELFEAIADSIKGGIMGFMFGCPCVKAENGKAAFCLRKSDLVIKLDKADEKEALALDGNGLFAPKGRPMGGGWVQIPFSNGDSWKHFALRSFAFVETLEAKEPKASPKKKAAKATKKASDKAAKKPVRKAAAKTKKTAKKAAKRASHR